MNNRTIAWLIVFSVFHIAVKAYQCTYEPPFTHALSGLGEALLTPTAPGLDGDKVLGLEVEAADGRPDPLRSFMQPPLTLVHFYKPWSGPCIDELGRLQAAAATRAQAPVHLIVVFSDSDRAAVTGQVAAAGLKPLLLRAQHQDILAAHIDVMPTSVLFDAHAHVLMAHSGPNAPFDAALSAAQSSPLRSAP